MVIVGAEAAARTGAEAEAAAQAEAGAVASRVKIAMAAAQNNYQMEKKRVENHLNQNQTNHQRGIKPKESRKPSKNSRNLSPDQSRKRTHHPEANQSSIREQIRGRAMSPLAREKSTRSLTSNRLKGLRK